MQTATRTVQDLGESAQSALKGLADSFQPVLERLAGTNSNLRVSFDKLELDTGTVRARLSGQIVLDVAYANQSASVRSKGTDSRLISKTTNVE